jgi:hypothetical protein
MRNPVLEGPPQGLMEVGSLVGEHVDGLVEVAVGGGLGDPERMAVAGDLRPVPEPRDHEHRLEPAGQRPAAFSRPAGFTFLAQQSGDVADEFQRDVEHGRISDHVEPFGGEVDLVVRPLLPEAPRLFQQVVVCLCVCPNVPVRCRECLSVRIDHAEKTSVGTTAFFFTGPNWRAQAQQTRSSEEVATSFTRME